MQKRHEEDARRSPPAVAGVHLFPRRKAGENDIPEKGRLPIMVDLDSIRLLFGIRQPDAAKRLAISLTALKQVCRKLGIVRWPYYRPCKRGLRYKPTRQVAIAVDEIKAPKLHPLRNAQQGKDDVDIRACSSDATDSDSGASTLHDSSHPELIFPSGLDTEGMSHVSSSSNAASMVTHTTDYHTVPLHFLPEEIPFMALDADDHDLGWLVSCGNLESHPLVEDLAFEMVWRERYALEAQKAETECSACSFSFTL